MSKFGQSLYLLLSIIGYFILSFLVSGLLGNYLNLQHAVLFVNLNKIMFLVITWFYIKMIHEKINGIHWKEYFSVKWIDIPKFMLGLTIPIILTILSLAILKVINAKIDFYVDFKAIAKNLGNSILISYSEELFFRCLIFISLVRIIRSVFPAALISSVFFALIHLGGMVEGAIMVSIFNIFIGGLVLCYIYHLTNSIWTSIGFHTLNNALSMIIQYPEQIQDYASKGALILYTGLLVIVLGVCLIADIKIRRLNSVT